METVVMAVDPGTWSGVSWCRVREGRWTREEVAWSVIEDGTGGTKEVTGPTEDHRAWAIIEAMVEIEPDVLVLEDFVLYPGRSHVPAQRSGTEPMRLNAKVEFVLWLCGAHGPWGNELAEEYDAPLDMILPTVVKQMASERLDITEQMVKDVGLWRGKSGKGKGKDSLAASQHLLHYVKKVNESSRRS